MVMIKLLELGIDANPKRTRALVFLKNQTELELRCRKMERT